MHMFVECYMFYVLDQDIYQVIWKLTFFLVYLMNDAGCEIEEAKKKF